MGRFSLLLITGSTLAQGTEKEQRIKASYMIAFGRLPSSGELSYWNRQGNYAFGQLVDNHKRYISSDVATKRSEITKSYNDAFGRNPSAGELKHWSQYSQSYTELMNAHVQWLASSPGEYTNVIKRSYVKVFRWQPSTGKLNFWKAKPYSYALLLACYEEYKRKQYIGRYHQDLSIEQSTSCS